MKKTTLIGIIMISIFILIYIPLYFWFAHLSKFNYIRNAAEEVLSRDCKSNLSIIEIKKYSSHWSDKYYTIITEPPIRNIQLIINDNEVFLNVLENSHCESYKYYGLNSNTNIFEPYDMTKTYTKISSYYTWVIPYITFGVLVVVGFNIWMVLYFYRYKRR